VFLANEQIFPSWAHPSEFELDKVHPKNQNIMKDFSGKEKIDKPLKGKGKSSLTLPAGRIGRVRVGAAARREPSGKTAVSSVSEQGI